ncbi:MAG: hypothetical protein K2X93_15510 [Candidatus Obscuribacterales bacterium]|nr:hypothetical protein [Candidatus Obscuribacterales bacterium]
MKTVISLRNEQTRQLPEELRNDDVRYTDTLVEFFLNQFTAEGEVVFDPFMGFGTTLVVAERMDRVGFGVEFDEKRWKYSQSLLKHPERALNGDSTKLSQIELPQIDFSITSPPYMGKHHKENPFTAYTTDGNGYQDYLLQMQDLYLQLSHKLKPSALVVVEVSNLKHEGEGITTLAWDIASCLSTLAPAPPDDKAPSREPTRVP